MEVNDGGGDNKDYSSTRARIDQFCYEEVEDDNSPLLCIPVSPVVQTPEFTPPSPWAASTCVRGATMENTELRCRPLVPQPGTTMPRSATEPKRAVLNRCNLANGSFTAENPSEDSSPSSSFGSIWRKEASGVDTNNSGLPPPAVQFGDAFQRSDLQQQDWLATDRTLSNDRSSMGLLSAEVLARSDSIVADSFALPNISFMKRYSREKAQDAVFKVPEPPSKTKEDYSGGLPLSLITPSVAPRAQQQDNFADTFMSINSSMANQSSFWEKVLQNNNGGECINADPEVSLVEDMKICSDEQFELINKTNDSFCKGQFSARSTSLGGSNESKGSGTRDERFSDFPGAEKLFAQNTYNRAEEVTPLNPFDPDGDDHDGFPSEFSHMQQQDVGEFSTEEFQCGGGQDLIDAAEKDFQNENRFVVAYEQPSSSVNMEFSTFSNSCSSFKAPEGQAEEVLSRSGYFMMNTSRLGGLNSTRFSDEERPQLGFNKIESPTRRRRELGVNATETTVSADSKESTYTVSSNKSAPASEENSRASLHLDKDVLLAKMVAEASPSQDPKHYTASLAQYFGHLKCSGVDREDTANATSISQFLTSFCDNTFDADGLQCPELATTANFSHTGGRTLSQPNDILFRVPKSRIPIPSTITNLQSGPKVAQSLQSHHDFTAASMTHDPSSAAPKMPDKISYSKDTPSRKRIVKGQRFSSPIKEVPANTIQAIRPATDIKKNLFQQKENDQPAQGNQSNAQVMPKIRVPLATRPVVNGEEKMTTTEKPASNFLFPIESDRAIVTWLSVGVGRSEEHIVTLRNISPRPLEVALIVRNSADFKIGLANSQMVTIDAMSTKDVAVLFSPSNTSLSQGLLVLKPRGILGQGGKASKASLLLQGQGGCPDIRLHRGAGDILSDRRSLNLGVVQADSPAQWDLEIANHGDAPAFFKLQGFHDADCRQADNTFISVEPPYGVLGAKRMCTVRVRLDMSRAGDRRHLSNGKFLGSLALFYGSEVCRQVMNRARLLPGAPRWSSSPALLCVDFTHSFGEESEGTQFAGKVVKEDVRHFYDKTRKEVIEITGHVEADIPRFKTLSVEETLNESMFNNTATMTPVVRPPPVTKERVKPIASPRGRAASVYLETDSLFFPLTKAGESSVIKVKLKNRTKEKQSFRVGELAKPFVSKHPEVTVQPGSFSSLPVFYYPKDDGPHMATMTFYGTADNGIQVLRATLKGNTKN